MNSRFALLAAAVVASVAILGAIDSHQARAIGFRDPRDSGSVHDTGGYAVFSTDNAVTVSTTATTSGAAALASGPYTITCDVASNIVQGTTGVTAATTSKRRIPADYPYPVLVTGNADNYFSIRGTASGTCVLSLDKYPF